MPTVKDIGCAVLVRYDGVSALGLRQRGSGRITAGVTSQARDEKGKTVDYKQIDWQSNVQLNLIPYSDVTKWPPKGAIVAISGFEEDDMNGNYRVVDMGEEQNNQGYPSKDYSFVRFLDNGVPGSTTTTTDTTTTTTTT